MACTCKGVSGVCVGVGMFLEACCKRTCSSFFSDVVCLLKHGAQLLIRQEQVHYVTSVRRSQSCGEMETANNMSGVCIHKGLPTLSKS